MVYARNRKEKTKYGGRVTREDKNIGTLRKGITKSGQVVSCDSMPSLGDDMGGGGGGGGEGGAR